MPVATLYEHTYATNDNQAPAAAGGTVGPGPNALIAQFGNTWGVNNGLLRLTPQQGAASWQHGGLTLPPIPANLVDSPEAEVHFIATPGMNHSLVNHDSGAGRYQWWAGDAVGTTVNFRIGPNGSSTTGRVTATSTGTYGYTWGDIYALTMNTVPTANGVTTTNRLLHWEGGTFVQKFQEVLAEDTSPLPTGVSGLSCGNENTVVDTLYVKFSDLNAATPPTPADVPFTIVPPTSLPPAPGVQSGDFTVQPTSAPTTALVVTPTDNAGGTFTPTSRAWAIGDTSAKTFKYTRSSLGNKTITLTGTGVAVVAPVTYPYRRTTATAGGDNYITYRPTGGLLDSASAPLVALFHGSTGDETQPETLFNPVIERFVLAGYRVVANNATGEHWERDSAQTATQAVIAAVAAAYPANALGLYGWSMGGALAFILALNANPSNRLVGGVPLKFVAGNCAVEDLIWCHNNGNYTNLINTAYGSSAAFEAAAPTNSPLAVAQAHPDRLAGLRVRGYADTTDPAISYTANLMAMLATLTGTIEKGVFTVTSGLHCPPSLTTGAGLDDLEALAARSFASTQPPTYTNVIVTLGGTVVASATADTLTLDFDASVQGTNNPSQTVAWSLIAGSVGSVNQSNGVYTRPTLTNAAQSATLRATAADGSTHADVAITVPAQTPTPPDGGGTGATAAEIVDELFARETEPGMTFVQVQRGITSVFMTEAANTKSDNPVYMSANGSKPRLSVILDAQGNRFVLRDLD